MSKSSEEGNLFESLNLREKILLGLLATGAVVETIIAEISTPISIGSAFRSLESEEFFRKRRTSSYSTVSYLLAEKLILAKGRGGQRVYQLTEEGLDLLFSKFPKLKYMGKPWDDYWRFVFYDIPEEECRLRDRLRKELKNIGFKFVQRSVWLTPLPVEEELKSFLKKEGLWGKILVLKSRLPADENGKLQAKFPWFSLRRHSRRASGIARAVDQLLG